MTSANGVSSTERVWSARDSVFLAAASGVSWRSPELWDMSADHPPVVLPTMAAVLAAACSGGLVARDGVAFQVAVEIDVFEPLPVAGTFRTRSRWEPGTGAEHWAACSSEVEETLLGTVAHVRAIHLVDVLSPSVGGAGGLSLPRIPHPNGAPDIRCSLNGRFSDTLVFRELIGLVHGLHTDAAIAAGHGLPSPAHIGLWTLSAALCHLGMSGLVNLGSVRRIECRFRRPALVDSALECLGWLRADGDCVARVVDLDGRIIMAVRIA